MIDLPALLERGEAYLAMTKAMSGGRVPAADAACIEIIRRAVVAEAMVEEKDKKIRELRELLKTVRRSSHPPEP